MLTLPRKKNETVVIGDDIVVTVVEINGDKVRLGVVVPRGVSVHRAEVFEAIHGHKAPIALRPADACDPLRCAYCRDDTKSFDPSWRTSTAVGLAHSMSETHNFGAMPILADALEEAGCDRPDVLAHCRAATPHVRGCWVVDLVLGES
jgi:carbon storage regulator CsrA